MKVLAIVQARVSSSRLPGKVLRPILGTPMLLQQIKRLKASQLIDHLVVATSIHKSDDPLVEIMENADIAYFRGRLANVLDRFYQAALSHRPRHIVRITGDCPVIDPFIVDDVIGIHLKEGNDYTTNALTPSFPDGLDIEIMTFDALHLAWEKSQLPSEKEHVTYFIQKHPELFKLKNVLSKNDLSFLRWTVDEHEDFELITEIYKELYPTKPDFNMSDILNLLELRPELRFLNTQFERNEGLDKSLQEDADFLKTQGNHEQ
jgi:spore coat polysaccharide biosynthesis protein SpsF